MHPFKAIVLGVAIVLAPTAAFADSPQNFDLGFYNGSGGKLYLNGPASYGVSVSPSFACVPVPPGTYARAGTSQFQYSEGAGSTAQYAFAFDNACQNNAAEFLLQAVPIGPAGCSGAAGYPSGIGNFYYTRGLNTCIYWRQVAQGYNVGLYSWLGSEPWASDLPLIVLDVCQSNCPGLPSTLVPPAAAASSSSAALTRTKPK